MVGIPNLSIYEYRFALEAWLTILYVDDQKLKKLTKAYCMYVLTLNNELLADKTFEELLSYYL